MAKEIFKRPWQDLRQTKQGKCHMPESFNHRAISGIIVYLLFHKCSSDWEYINPYQFNRRKIKIKGEKQRYPQFQYAHKFFIRLFEIFFKLVQQVKQFRQNVKKPEHASKRMSLMIMSTIRPTDQYASQDTLYYSQQK